jgi:hypothetical protein
MFMNHWEIDEMVERYQIRGTLSRASCFLAEFRNQVNAHSDGWAYWRAPVRAAKQLMILLEKGEASEEGFAKALRPIKSFYTRIGYSAGMKWPADRGGVAY